MHMKHKVMLAGLVALPVIGATSLAMAADTGANPRDTLVEKLATKFNLNKDDVKAVFDEEHAAREAEHQKAYEEKLAQAVTDGKLTQEQADKVIAKSKELQAAREAHKTDWANLGQDERKAKIDEERTAIDQWLKDNNIDRKWLMMGGRGGHGMGRGHGMGDMMHDNADTSNTSAQSN